MKPLTRRVFSWIIFQAFLISSQAQDTPQHTFDFQPNYYSFQSIGTNELPPQLAGQFVSTTTPRPNFAAENLVQENEDLQLPPSNFAFSNPTGAPVHFFSTTRPMPHEISSLSIRPQGQVFTSRPPFVESPQDVDLFQEVNLATSQPQILADGEVLSRPNEISQNTVPILPPNPTPDYYDDSYEEYIEYPSNEYPTNEYNDYEDYSTNDYEYNNIDQGFQEPQALPSLEPQPVTQTPPIFSSTLLPQTFSTTIPPFNPSEPPIRFLDEEDQVSIPSYYNSYYEPPEEPEFRDEIIETLPAETSLLDPNLQCYERTCDQNITGRDLTYERALEIIQTEEYLTAADIDLIIKKKKKKRSINKYRCKNGFNVLFKDNCRRTGLDLSNIFPFSLFLRGPIRGPFNPPSSFTRRPRFRFKPRPDPIVIQQVLVDPPLVPINVAQPGLPGGGGTPARSPEAVALVPNGLRPVTVFPPYLFPRTVPAVCVIFLEPKGIYPPKPEPQYEHHYGYNKPPNKPQFTPIVQRVKSYFKSLKKTIKRRLDKSNKRVKRQDLFSRKPKAPRVHLVEVPSFERRYGFRCRVTLVDRQQCQLGVSCDTEGNRLSDRIKKRQIGDEFIADGPPECRTELSPLGCTPAFKL